MRRLLLFLLSVSIVAGVVTVISPTVPSTVEIALDYSSTRRFAVRQGYPLDKLFAEFRRAGVTTLLVGEATLYDLTDQGQLGYRPDYPVRVAVLSGDEVRARAQVDITIPVDHYQIGTTYIFVRDNPELAAFLARTLSARFGNQRVAMLPRESNSDSPLVIGLKAVKSTDLLLTPLGLLPVDLETAESHGFRLAVSLSQRPYSDDVIPRVPPLIRTVDPAALVSTLPSQPVTIFLRGQEVPGYPNLISHLAAVLSDRGDILALHRERAPGRQPFPAGLDQALAQMGLAQIKAYVVSYRDRIDDWTIAAKERGIRFFVIQAFPLSASGEKDVATVSGWVRTFVKGLHQAGLSVGRAEPRTLHSPLPFLAALISGGVMVGVLVLAERFWASPEKRGRVTTTSAMVAAILLVGGAILALVAPVTGRQALALLAAVAFPSLGALGIAPSVQGVGHQVHGQTNCDQPGRLWPGPDLRLGLAFSIRMTLWSVAGGILLHALLLSPHFWLEFELFRGVKLSLLVPSLLVVAQWTWQRRNHLRADLLRIGNYEIQFGHLLAGVLMLTVAGVLIMRSTYAGGLVADEEILLRGALERWLWVRPRFKEIFFGYPALFVAGAAFRQGRQVFGLVALAAGAVAGASVTNSFAHVHIPISLTILRTFHGLWIGTLFGGILLVSTAMFQRIRRASGDG